VLGDEVSSKYVEGIIAESGVHEDKRISYDEFLSLWEHEIDERKLELVRGISQSRTVNQIEAELYCASSGEGEISCSDIDF